MKRRTKRGQVKFGENVAIMIIFFILLAMGLLFYGAWQKGSIKESIQEQFTKEAIRIALTVSHLPEVVCSQDNYIIENCFDEYKVRSLERLIISDDESFLNYEALFHDSNITITKIFPYRETFNLYDNSPEEFVEVVPTYIPIILKDPRERLDQGNSIAILKVEVFR